VEVAKDAPKAAAKARAVKVEVAKDVPKAAAKVEVAKVEVVAVLASKVVVANLAPRHKAEPGLVFKADSLASMRGVVRASRAGRVAEQPFARPAAMRTFALPLPMPVLAVAAIMVQPAVAPRPTPASALVRLLGGAHSLALRLPWITC